MGRRDPGPRHPLSEPGPTRSGRVLALPALLAALSISGAAAQGAGGRDGDETAVVSGSGPIVPGPNALIDARLTPAPQEFESTDAAIWDGRRTLQGIWIAHPRADTARRVRILNLDTGFAVDGALFRRDGGSAGPEVLVSSDAAVTLGMTPNEPANLSIVAIRRTPVPQVAEVAEDTDLAAIDEEETKDAVAEDTGVGAAAVVDPEPTLGDDTQTDAAQTLVGEPTVASETAAAEPATEVAEPETASEDAPATAELAAVTPDPEPDETADGPEPATRPEAPAEAEPDPEAASATSTSAASGADPVEDWPIATDAAPAQTETVTADPPAPAPLPEPEPDVAVVAPEPDPEPTEPAPTRPQNPFIQSGIFGVEENARRLIQRLREAGFPSEGKPLRSGERTLTRVISGPFESQAELNRALAEIRRIGPKDAIPVRR